MQRDAGGDYHKWDFGPNQLMVTSEVAAVFKVDLTTVLEWAYKGELAFIRTPGGHRRFSRQQVEQIIWGQGPRSKWDFSPEQLMLPSEAGAVFRVGCKTLWLWTKQGRLDSIRTIGGERRYSRHQVEHIMGNGLNRRRNPR
ncbi:helix-turn-helix domain-containing protein [Actinomadura sp. KC216]|nr:helix-turn-helix domain-containing protein [Actinomadura sp. KC216]